MFCVGLTGTIGSGKSSALAFFQSLGATVISADLIAKQLTLKGQKAYKRIMQHFGCGILGVDDEINRAALRQKIFENKAERLWLEALLHPLIRQEIQEQIKNSSALYCIIEIPLLTSRESYPYLDRILVVQTEPEIQLQRVMARDNCDAQAALKIVKTQASNATLQLLADDLVINNGTIQALGQKIAMLHHKYLELSQA